MRDEVELLAGVRDPSAEAWEPFCPAVMDFLERLSARVRTGARQREELAAFGFWCRRAHLNALKERHACALPRLGRGLIFHLAPSNVPAMFAYTYAIGLLAGNANIVRLSSRRSEIEAELLDILREVLDEPASRAVRARSAFVAYPRSDEITAELLAECDGRVIWGGDATVTAMRRLPMPPHAVEVCFPDRWSLALLSQQRLAAMDEPALADLAHRFYNDTYMMDQNACSSPQLVLWLADGGSPDVRVRWWQALAKEAQARYPLGAFQAARKYERFCQAAMVRAQPGVAKLDRYGGNLLYVARLKALPDAPMDWKGGFGLFFEGELASLDGLLPLLSAKTQTIACAGPEPGEVAAFLAQRHAAGVDRVVPFGQALEMDTIWDGRDLIAALSRVIC